MLYGIIDDVLFSHQIDALLVKAAVICPEMTCKIYPANVKRLFPNETDEFCTLGAELFNDLAFNLLNRKKG